MKRLPAIAALAGLLSFALSGCSNDCVNLANQICECSTSQQAQTNCTAAVTLANGTAQLSSTDLARCTALLASCDCRMLSTGSYSAKVACGLARPDPGDSALNP